MKTKSAALPGASRPAAAVPAAALLALCGCAVLNPKPPQVEPPPGEHDALHVPSPDWRDQVIYFVMTDRFSDGDPANNDQGRGEYDPRDGGLYSGGDLAGLRGRLDYIQKLGATAVWLTPPVANVWRDPTLRMAGYHGYWAHDFKSLDAHLGALQDYRKLSTDLHLRGMYLIQDVVANHTADFFRYEGAYDLQDPAKNFKLKPGMVPPRPTQYPFSMNNAVKRTQRDLAAYHWTPDIMDYNSDIQRLTYQMSGLDDLNTSSPLVRETLRASYGYWIRAAGVDGFRVDTARYVEHAFWHDFIHSTAAAAPGVEVYARRFGREDFLTFGEVWGNATPFSDAEDVVTASYLGTDEAPEMKAVLNFPLAIELREVFGKGAPAARLAFRLAGLGRHYAGGRASVNFMDNHDMPRFLAEGPEKGLVQALAALFTMPGIPAVYAGTEQGFTETRASMFAGGFGSGGKDHFEVEHPLYRLIQRLAALRAAEPVLRRGSLEPLHGAKAGAGPLAWRLDKGDERAVALFNTADEEMLLAGLETGLEEGAVLEPLLALELPKPERVRLGKAGKLSLSLPGRSVLVLKSTGAVEPVLEPAGAVAISTIRKEPGTSGVASFSGTSSGVGDVSLVVDGRVTRAVKAAKAPDGTWSAAYDSSALPDGEHPVLAVGSVGPNLAISEPRSLHVSVPFVPAGTAEDPLNDDRGLSWTYVYPLAKGFQGKADIEAVSLYRRGAASLKLSIRMAERLSSDWNPPFGFDHVCFDIYIVVPDHLAKRPGAGVLPRLNASMKDGADWDYAAFVSGWSAGLYSSEGATPSAFGRQLRPAPRVSVNKAVNAVEVVFDLEAFEGLPSFDGWRFYVTTWDYDGAEGRLRPLDRSPGAYTFGGGAPTAPRIMDDTALFP